MLDGATTNSEKLQQKGELSQFWRVLAGCVTPNGVNDGRRIDLLGCRVVEAPRDGAALLKELWRLTAVPFAAADDAMGGYMLSTFMEEPHSGQLSIISSTIRGMDLYFDKYTLLGIQPPLPGQPLPQTAAPPPPSTQYNPPLPAGVPPPTALMTQPPGAGMGMAPAAPMAAAAPYGMPGTVGAAPTAGALGPVPPTRRDIFSRFNDNVRLQAISLPDVFKKYDVDRSGYLGLDELSRLLVEVVPDSAAVDLQHFRSMMDVDNNQRVTYAEFLNALESNTSATKAVSTVVSVCLLHYYLHTSA